MLVVKDESVLYSESARLTEILDLVTEVAGISRSKARSFIGAIAPGAADSNTVLHRLGGLMPYEMMDAGLNEAQADRLKACLKLGTMTAYARNIKTISDPYEAATTLMKAIGSKKREHFAVLIMDIKHKVLATEIIAIGTTDECIADPKQIFTCILKHGGVRAIVAHNHPSGNVSPSSNDMDLTEQLLAGSKVLNVPILDHIVVGPDSYHSMRQHESHLWKDALA